MDSCADSKHGMSFVSMIGNVGLRLVWRFLHLLVSSFYLVAEMASAIESYLISVTTRQSLLNTSRIKYLAVVVESEEALHFSKVVNLLLWLHDIGVNRVCLYDNQGVMKRSRKVIMESFENERTFKQGGDTDKLVSREPMTLEFASSSDGKETVVKAANLLFREYVESADSDKDREEKIFTEARMGDALKAIGGNGTEPDLLLVYGPARCHLGFPSWRIRYTEIVHMGPLKSMRRGSLIKAIYKFTMVRQNYGR